MAVDDSWKTGDKGFVLNSLRTRAAPAAVIASSLNGRILVYNEAKKEEQEFFADTGYAAGEYEGWVEQHQRPKFVRDTDAEALALVAKGERRDMMVSNFDRVVEAAKAFKDAGTFETYDVLNDAVIEWGQDAGLVAE